VRYRFVDCRWSLDDPDWGKARYLDGHIPGAAFLDVERDLSAPPGPPGGRHPLPDAAGFARAAGAAGIGAGVFVVAYGSLGGAERLWWLLRHFGHDDCSVIDLAGWHGPFTHGEEPAEPAAFEPSERADDTIHLHELAARHRELVVLDSRLPPRWRGEENPIDRVPGRIPGALNAPWSEPLPDVPPGELVAYCGSGITACVTLHRLHLAGRTGRLYPGSWSEWEQHDELPREHGP
jgi:thiosulfate/3-mercaptopyruvate sulfurtransferase